MMNHNVVNRLNRMFLKTIIRNIPIQRTALDILPEFLHLFDFAAEATFGCRIDQTEMGYLPVEWISSPQGDANPDNVILFLHGGGYVALGPITHRGITTYMARVTGSRVLSIRYRKAPEHQSPAQLEDGLYAYQQLLKMGYKEISIMGDSAGGNLALALAHKIKRDGKYPLPASVVVLSPWTDLTMSGDTFDWCHKDHVLPKDRVKDAIKAFAGDMDAADPRISPLFDDYEGFPPLLIHVGTDEILLSDSTRLYDFAKAAKVDVEMHVWPRGAHVFQAWALILPEARDSLDECAGFISRRWTKTYKPH